MNPELEALVHAWDAFLEAADTEAARREQLYSARFQEALERNPGVSPHLFQKAIESAYRKWRRAQETKTSALPPKA